MIVYAPYIAVLFWGTMIFFGLRSALIKGQGPLVEPLRDIKNKMGVLLWVAVGLLFLIVVFFVSRDSEAIRERRTPVGIFTTLAFLPLIAADALLAAKLFLGDSPHNEE